MACNFRLALASSAVEYEELEATMEADKFRPAEIAKYRALVDAVAAEAGEDGEVVEIQSIVDSLPIGSDSTRRLLLRLQDAGYVSRARPRGTGPRSPYVYYLAASKGGDQLAPSLRVSDISARDSYSEDRLLMSTIGMMTAKAHVQEYQPGDAMELRLGQEVIRATIDTATQGQVATTDDLRYHSIVVTLARYWMEVHGAIPTFMTVEADDLIDMMEMERRQSSYDAIHAAFVRLFDTSFVFHQISAPVLKHHAAESLLEKHFGLFSSLDVEKVGGTPKRYRVALDPNALDRIKEHHQNGQDAKLMSVHREWVATRAKPWEAAIYLWSRRCIHTRTTPRMFDLDWLARELVPRGIRSDGREAPVTREDRAKVKRQMDRLIRDHWDENLQAGHYLGYLYRYHEEQNVYEVRANPQDWLLNRRAPSDQQKLL